MPFIEEFDSKRATYERLQAALEALLTRAAADIGVTIFRIEGRVKSRDSIQEKLSRPEKAGKYETLADMTDLCGIRLVAFDSDACTKLIAAVRQHFSVDEINSVDKSGELEDDRFGYTSTHLVVSLPPARAEFFEYRDLVGLTAEIQIRTVLQHAWAVLDHNLRYKSKIEAPKELRRKLFRISAMLEAADEAFLDINKMSEQIRAEYTKDVQRGILNISLNKDSIETFIQESKAFKRILKLCKSENLPYTLSTTGATTAWSYLIKSLESSGIKNLQQLEEALRSITKENILTAKEIFQGSSAGAYGPFSLIRNLVVSTLPLEDRIRVISETPSAKHMMLSEQAVFSRP